MNITLSIYSETHSLLKSIADFQDRPMNYVLDQIVREYAQSHFPHLITDNESPESRDQ